jgi:Cu2+-exporting ATPase/Cu+-exporting ATPase
MRAGHCAQCDLPVPIRPLRARVRGQEHVFCCYGCYLVLWVTGVKGEACAAQGLMLRLGFGLFFSLNVMVFSLARYGEYFAPPSTLLGAEADTARFNLLLEYLLLGLASPVMALIGVPLLRRFADELRRLTFSIDSLIGIATFAAFGLSVRTTLTGGGAVFYDTATWLLVLITLGRYLETRAKARTTDAIAQLLDLAPTMARRRGQDGGWQEVVADDLRVGDTIQVRPGEGIPADGVCLAGDGHVDQAALNGETEPVAVAAGTTMRAGTVSIDAAFTMRVDGPPGARLLDRIAALMREARDQRAPTQRLADRIAGWVTPVVLACGALTFLYWRPLIGTGDALLHGLSVWVIACPCALGIATPMALWVGLGVAARRGLLIRSAAVLERLAAVDTVCFDKTGTLTSNEMEVVEVVTAAGTTAEALRQAVAALEACSEHPVGRSLARWAGESSVVSLARLRTVAGRGMRGEGAGTVWLVGRRDWLEDEGLFVPPALVDLPAGRWVCVGWGGAIRGAIRLGERLQASAEPSLRRLATMGYPLYLLSGDTEDNVYRLAHALPVPITARGGLLPDGKIAVLGTLVAGGKRPLMVGDGINDAPALAAAPVGLAIAGGTDLSRAAADVVALHVDLGLVPELLHLARRVHRTMVTNLAWAFAYNLVGVALAAAGRLSPVFAASAMLVSSLLVIGNSLRLNRHLDGTVRGINHRDGRSLRSGPEASPVPSTLSR